MAFSVSNERITGSAQAPRTLRRDDQFRQNASVRAKASPASKGSGGGRCEAPQVRVKATLSPSPRSNAAIVDLSRPISSTSVRRTTRLGPQTAWTPSPPSICVTHGTAEP